ncbi:MAG: hypothetical protein Q8880_00180 [Bacteroidota bacterium]|nr:hypothetical protein [Bacteroidota bacterium]
MLRITTVLILLFPIVFLSCNQPIEKNPSFIFPEKQTQITQSDTNIVYICQSPYAYAYHKTSNCEGLIECNHEITKITLKEALRLKRKKCMKCFIASLLQ